MTARRDFFSATFATADQELLLKALVFDGPSTVDCWKAWHARVALDDVDGGSQRLLPLLLDKLRHLGVEHPDLIRYQGIARYWWAQNRLRVRTARQILDSFAAAGIQAMLLKGLAIALLYYRDMRLRPMSDFDILVPASSVTEATRLLNDRGWHAPTESLVVSESYRRTRHAAQFVNAHGLEIDLHWHVTHDGCRQDSDDVFWRHAQPLVIEGLETKTLSDTDHLLHACIHGAMPNEVPPIRWIIDSAQIIRSRPVDWSRLLDQTHEFDVVRRLQRTLGYLHGTFALPIPQATIAELMAMRPSRIELFDEHVQLSRLPLFWKLAVWRYCHYRRNAALQESFLGYLQESRGKSSRLATLAWLINRMRG